MATKDSCFHAYVSKICCSIVYAIEKATTFKLRNYLNTILGMLDLSYKQSLKFSAQTVKV